MTRALLLAVALGATGCNLLLGLDETSSASGDDDPVPDAMPGDFDAMPIDAEPVPGECQPSTQLGCPVSESCDFDFTGGVAFCRIAGSAGPGDTCAMPTDCGIGLTCQGGACRELCGNHSECTTPVGHCHPTALGVSFCDASCDLRANDCGAGYLCTIATTPDNTEYISYCVPGSGGTLGLGADCTTDPGGCVPGALCVDITGDSVPECTQICYLGDGTCANCGGVTDGSGQITIHGNDLGVCVP